MDCPHDLDAEYLYPSDVDVLSLEDRRETIVTRFALACPDCGTTLELTATVDSIEESDLVLPLDDLDEGYD